MSRLFVLLTAVLISNVAAAQPAQQQEPSPAEVALQLNNVINSWAQAIIQQNKTIAELQKQLAAAKANKESEPPKEAK